MNKNKLIFPILVGLLCSSILNQCGNIDDNNNAKENNSTLLPVNVNPTCYKSGDSSFFLISGEFHYFRVPKKDWKRRMQLFKEAGGNCIATYIPWLLHEPKEGKFLFGDTSFRDLETFLKTAKEVGLYVIVRPGPYQYSELKNGGLPDWLINNYPQIKALRYDGTPIHSDAVSYLHPLYLKKVKQWFDAFMPIVAKYTTTSGNPVAMIQLDNELTGIHIWRGSIDYNPETMGFGLKDGRFTRYLQKKYCTIQILNKYYKTRHTAFDEVRPIEPKAYNELYKILRVKDYYDFYFETVAEYVNILSEYVKTYAPDILLIHNSGNPEMNAFFKETVKKMKGSSFILGSDHYYSLDQNWEQNNPTPQYARQVLYSLELLRLFHFPPTVFEMPSGSASDWPPATPNNARACYYTHLAFGMKGLNYYIFTGGPNPLGYGVTTDVYDYGAPVSATGEIRPLYYVQKEFADFVTNHPWIVEAGRMYDCRIAIDPEYCRAQEWWKDRGNCLVTGPDVQDFMMKGILSTALTASLSPRLIDLSQDDWLEDITTPVIIASSSSMSESNQKQIISFIQKGGKVLIAPVIPSLDENLSPCKILSDFIRSPKLEPMEGYTRANIGQVSNIKNDGLYIINGGNANEVQIVGEEEESKKPIAKLINFKNGGALLLLGMKWTYSNTEQLEMFKSLLTKIGLKPLIHSDNPNIWFSILRNNGKSLLFMINLFTDSMSVSVQLKTKEMYQNIGVFDIEPMTVKCIELNPDLTKNL
jgi:beta-galactosidase